MTPSFDRAFELTVGIEGGYSNDPRDPGGETNFGISKRAHPGEDIKNLTLERAKQIYFHDYWVPAGCAQFVEPVAVQLFDTAVNAGVSVAIKQLQRAVGVKDDGVIGPKTVAAVREAHPGWVVAGMVAQRLRHWTDLKTWSTYGKGWARRAATLLEVR